MHILVTSVTCTLCSCVFCCCRLGIMHRNACGICIKIIFVTKKSFRSRNADGICIQVTLAQHREMLQITQFAREQFQIPPPGVDWISDSEELQLATRSLLCPGKNIQIHSGHLNSRRPSSFASKRQTALVGLLPLRLQNDWNHAEFNMYIPRYILIQLSMGAKHLEQQPRPPNNLALNPVKTWGFGKENWWFGFEPKEWGFKKPLCCLDPLCDHL